MKVCDNCLFAQACQFFGYAEDTCPQFIGNAKTEMLEQKRKDEKAMKNKEQHDEFVRNVRNIGEYLIKNAESIVGTESGLYKIEITTTLWPDQLPTIDISKSVDPLEFK